MSCAQTEKTREMQNVQYHYFPAGSRHYVLYGSAQCAGTTQAVHAGAEGHGHGGGHRAEPGWRCLCAGLTTAGGSHRLHYPKPARGKSFAVGDTVTLYYDPDDPEKMYVEGDRATLGAEVLYAVIGVALLVLTVGIAR